MYFFIAKIKFLRSRGWQIRPIFAIPVTFREEAARKNNELHRFHVLSLFFICITMDFVFPLSTERPRLLYAKIASSRYVTSAKGKKGEINHWGCNKSGRSFKFKFHVVKMKISWRILSYRGFFNRRPLNTWRLMKLHRPALSCHLSFYRDLFNPARTGSLVPTRCIPEN